MCTLMVLFLIIKKHKLCHVYNNTYKIQNKIILFLKRISVFSVVNILIINYMFLAGVYLRH